MQVISKTPTAQNENQKVCFKNMLSGFKYTAPCSLVAILYLLSVATSQVSALTYSNEMDVQFTFNPTVSINVTGDLTIAELAPGNALDSNIITVTAGSNEANGYTLYSTVGSSTNNYTDLRLSGSNTTNVFTNLSANKTALADFDNNTWGYSYCLTTNDCDTDNTYWVSGNAGSTVAGYNGLPIYDASDNTTGVVLAKTDSAAETELKFKIGAKAAANQASGTYTNIVNFISVAKVITTNYTLNYNANAGTDTVTNMPTNISNGTTNTSAITLSTTTPVRENYTFKGWCTDNSSETSCSGTLYGPGRIYVLASPGTTTTVNLYAIWEAPTVTFDEAFAAANKTQTGGYYTMQDADTSICSAVTVGQTGQLIDTRDSTVYNVAKLADNKCWMLDNLAIDLTSVTLANLQGKTNASNTTLGYLKNGGGSTSDKYATAGVSNRTSGYSYSAPLINTASKTKKVISYGAGNGYVGVYYNYCAASAGSYCYGNATSAGTSFGNATEDICPSNTPGGTSWHMPTGGSDGEYITLYNRYSNTTAATDNASLQYNLSTPLSGVFFDGSAGEQDSSGVWWSSTRENDSSMYVLRVYASNIDTAIYGSRAFGVSVRCTLGS